MALAAVLDSETQVVAIVVNFLIACLLGVLAYFGRQAWQGVKHMVEKVNHIDECLDRTQAETTSALRETRDDIVEVKKKLEAKDVSDVRTQRELAYLKGVVGTPLDQPVGGDLGNVAEV